MGRVLVLASSLVGCSFAPGKLATQPDDAGEIDVATGSNDAMPDVALPDVGLDAALMLTDIAHVSAADESSIAPTADITWSGTVTIDATATPSVNPSLPSGARIRSITQEVGGTPVVILEVRSLVSTANVRVTGNRPLIIFASQSITITSGVLDASARGASPGPGARTTGAGVGQTGTHQGQYSDGGGGGGGHGTAGAAGGTATENSNVGNGGAAGGTVGSANLAELVGGSPGGAGQPTTCSMGTRASGGAGGGALQLSATSISIGGLIVAGGGGGEGGGLCQGNMASAGGGGSGGAIYLQALVLTGTGTLAANGGGGGAGSNWNGGPGVDGQNGADALTAAIAMGAPMVAPDGGSGGAGATTAAATPGQSINSVYPNGGGGGGGAGRIYLDVPSTTSVTLVSSPAAQRP